MSGPAPRLRDRIGNGRAIALIDGNSFYCSCERVAVTLDERPSGLRTPNGPKIVALSDSKTGCAGEHHLIAKG